MSTYHQQGPGGNGLMKKPACNTAAAAICPLEPCVLSQHDALSARLGPSTPRVAMRTCPFEKFGLESVLCSAVDTRGALKYACTSGLWTSSGSGLFQRSAFGSACSAWSDKFSAWNCSVCVQTSSISPSTFRRDFKGRTSYRNLHFAIHTNWVWQA